MSNIDELDSKIAEDSVRTSDQQGFEKSKSGKENFERNETNQQQQIGILLKDFRDWWKKEVRFSIKIFLIGLLALYVWFVFGGDTNVNVSIGNWDRISEDVCEICSEDSEPSTVIQPPMQIKTNPNEIQTEGASSSSQTGFPTRD